MAIEKLFDSASSIMTVVSFVTFIGILWWTFIAHRNSDFDAAAHLPFADDFADDVADTEAETKAKTETKAAAKATEARHV